VRLLVAEGARVVIADVLENEADVLAGELGEATMAVRLDVRKEADWTNAVSRTLARFSRLDVLVNNAGIRVPGRVDTMELSDYMQVIEVNQVGCFLGMQAVAPAMAESGGGSIVNTSSAMAGLRGRPGSIAYTATKWAIRGMSRAAALDLAELGIRVNVLLPGLIDTEMMRGPLPSRDLATQLGSMVPLQRVGTPEEVAGLVLFLASPASEYCTGSEFVIDGGVSA
jgi:3alpha(or 20beta)-hydroxysteroid dehydrogenase